MPRMCGVLCWMALFVCGCSNGLRPGPIGEPFAQLIGVYLQPNGEFRAPCNAARFDVIGEAVVSYFEEDPETGQPSGAVPAVDYDITFPDADAASRDPYVNVIVSRFDDTELVFEVSFEATVFSYETIVIHVEFLDEETLDFQFVVRNDCPPSGSAVITQVVVPPTLRSRCSLITRTGPGDEVTFAGGVVWECDPPLAQLAQVASPEVFFLYSDGLRINQLRRTPDRTQGAFLSDDPALHGDSIPTVRQDLFHLDLATGDIRRLTRFREETDSLSVTEHAWSRDGTKVLMRVVDTDDGTTTFVSLEIATGELTEVASFAPLQTGLPISRPVFSPDGNKIAYAIQGHLHVIDLVAGTDTRIVENDQVIDPDWHPSEDRIVYAIAGGGMVVVDSTGAELSTLAGGPLPEWSWDGAHIAFVGGDAVSILEVATGDVTTLPETEGPKYQDW